MALNDSCKTGATITGVEGCWGKTGRVAMFLAPHRSAAIAAACRIIRASRDEIRRSSFMSPMGSYLPVTASLSASTYVGRRDRAVLVEVTLIHKSGF